MYIQHFKYSLIILALLFISSVANANDLNTNELLKMDVDQTSENSVKLNIYTDKPYNEQIIVNKKPDNKYVILLPETTNAMSTQPDFSNISNIKNIDIKTQQYSSLPGKGYTKITIDSKKPIEIIPQAHVKPQINSKRITTKKPVLSSEQVQMTVPQRILNQRKPVTAEDFTISEKQAPKNSDYGYTSSSIQSENRYRQPITNRVSQITQTESRASRNILSSFTQQNSITTESSNNSTLSQNEQTVTEDNNNAVDNEITTNENTTDNEEFSEADLEFFKKLIRIKQKITNKIKQILAIRISFVSFMTVLQFILLIILVKVIKDLVQKIQDTTEQQPLTRKLIHDNNETFEQSYPSIFE